MVESHRVRAERAAVERLAAGVLMIGFPGHTVPPEAEALIARGVRSFILFARNIGDADAVRSLVAELRALAGDDALIAIDHEGGYVNRLDGVATPWPSALALAATGDLDLVRRASACWAQELAALGINLNFAPVADLLSNYRNPVLGIRCFSDDPALAARYTTAFVEGHRQVGVAATAKHFPGHGDTATDSHLDLPQIALDREALAQADLVPFGAAVAAQVDCLMISHVWYSGIDDTPTPASVSTRVPALARDDLRFDGVIVSDCMEMGAVQNHFSTGEAVLRAVAAGTDLVLVSHQAHLQQEALDRLTTAALDGSLPLERLHEADRRLAALRSRVAGTDAAMPQDGPALARQIAAQAVTVVRDQHHAIPLQLDADQPLGVVTFERTALSLVEDPRSVSSRVEDAVRRHHPRCVVQRVAEGTSSEAVVNALAAARVVVVATASATHSLLQREVVEALRHAGKTLIVVACNDPFDLLSFPEVPCYLVTYGDTAPQLDAATDILFGTAVARGTLPVELPGLYPRGHRVT